MAVDVLRAIGEAIGAIREAPEANRPPGVLYAKCALKYSFGGAWAFGTAYILGKYNADPQQMINLFQKIALPAGVILMGMSTGCLKLALQAESLSSLKELWKRYTQGVLQNALSQALLTPDLLRFAEEGNDVELEVQIDERIYQEACLDLMVKSVLQVHQDDRNTSLSRRRSFSESNINLISNVGHTVRELSLKAKAQIKQERQEMKAEEHEEKQETQPNIIDPSSLLAEPTGMRLPPIVLFLNIDKETVFEKMQVKSQKRAQQRIINGEVQMLANSESQISAIKVWVFREPEAAKLCGDKQGRQELPVTIKEQKIFETHFSVNLDDVYAGPKGPFYVLTKIDVKRRNVFQLSSVLYFIDGTKSEEFFSKPFRIRTRSEAAITKSVSSPIPSPEFRNTHIGVHTLVSDRVFASSVTMDNIMSTISLDLGAAKSIEKSSTFSKVCTDLVRADNLIARTIVCETISTSTESEDTQGLHAERVRESLIATRPRKRKRIKEGEGSKEKEKDAEGSTSSHITAHTITVERLIVRCLTCDVIQVNNK